MKDLTQDILRAAAGKRAVAFDVFDTLIFRDVPAPADLFALLGGEFCAARLAAEAAARAASPREVTLAAVYADPRMAGFDPKAECRAELAACVPNAPLLAAARACRARGQRVYAVSDMYLPQAQIAAMLRKCGYDFLDGVYVSSEYGVQKRSGALFRLFLRREGLAAREVLFVGDDVRADVCGAALAGVPALRVKARPVRARTPAQGRVTAFVQNRLPLQNGTAGRLGFGTAGPLVTAFAQWVHAQRAARPQARVFFLARDMFLVRRAYQTLYPAEQSGYLRVSRRALCPALLERGRYDLLAAALPRQTLTGAQIADFCGSACPPQNARTRFDLKNPPDAALNAFLRALPAASGAAELTLRYLRAQGLQAGDFLADIGSGGTTQRLLEGLTGETLHGLYLACDERLHAALPPGRAAVFLFGGRPAPRLYWAGQPILERLISQDCGATLGYRPGADGGVRVCEAPCRPSPTVAALQKAALAFARDWRGSVLADRLVPPGAAAAPFLRLIARPTAAEAALLGPLTVEDGGAYPVAAPQGWGAYLRRPAALRADFSAARWKIGFCKRLLRLPLPYDKLYLAFKR